MEQYIRNTVFASRRLFTFLATLFVRLNLGRNNYSWNVVRLCVRSGFYVRFDLETILAARPAEVSSDESFEIRDGQIVCFACQAVAYASLNEFVHAVFTAYNDRSMSKNEQEIGQISADSEFFHLAHRANCDRARLNADDLTSYVDLLVLRRLCAAAFASNSAMIRTQGNYVCRICMSRTTDVSTVPCGHVYACFDCLMTSLQENRSPTNCFICREIVTAIQQLYFA
jgi:hypothetical protein